MVGRLRELRVGFTRCRTDEVADSEATRANQRPDSSWRQRTSIRKTTAMAWSAT